MRYLVVKQIAAQKAQQFKIVAPVISIGRTSENSIALKDSSVSRQHCVIETSNNVTRIRDVGSFHGFVINDKQSREAILHHGDRVVIGSFELFYIVTDDEPNGTGSGAATEQSTTLNGDGESATVEGGDDKTGALSEIEHEAESEPEAPVAPTGAPPSPVPPDPQSDRSMPPPATLETEDFDPLPIELRTGDFPVKASDNDEQDEMDLNQFVSKANPSRPKPNPAPETKAPEPPAAKRDAPAPTPRPGPQTNGKDREKKLESEAAIKQLQHEFGELLKNFEANKKSLKSAVEALEVEQLKSSTAAKKYVRVVEKLKKLESQLSQATHRVAELEAEQTQATKDYHELDERLHATETQRAEAFARAESLSTDLAALTANRDDLQKHATELQKEKDEFEGLATQLKSQFSTARKKVAQLETAVNTMQESRLRAKNAVVNLETDSKELKSRLVEAESQRDEFESRVTRLDAELKATLTEHAAVESKVVQAQKASLESTGEVRDLRQKLAEADDRINTLEDELEAAEDAARIAAPGSGASGGGGIDQDKVKRKLGQMENERRAAVAAAQQTQAKLDSAHQQAAVLQSFLDEREALITKLRSRLKQYETVDGDTTGG